MKIRSAAAVFVMLAVPAACTNAPTAPEVVRADAATMAGAGFSIGTGTFTGADAGTTEGTDVYGVESGSGVGTDSDGSGTNTMGTEGETERGGGFGAGSGN